MSISATSEQFDLPAMPKTSKFVAKVSKVIREAKKEQDAFKADFAAFDGLYSKAVAARLCNVSSVRIHELVTFGRFQVFVHFDREWLSGADLQKYIESDRKGGRPWKIPSGVGIIKDMAKDMGGDFKTQDDKYHPLLNEGLENET